jgi:hypothetical protein
MDKGTQDTQEPRPTDAREGTWTRLELIRMNARFVAAMERALAEEEERERSEPFAQGSSQHPHLRSRTYPRMKDWAA